MKEVLSFLFFVLISSTTLGMTEQQKKNIDKAINIISTSEKKVQDKKFITYTPVIEPTPLNPLIPLAMAGDEKALILFKNRGGNVNGVFDRKTGCTGLALATLAGNRPGVEFFLKQNKATLDAPDVLRRRPISFWTLGVREYPPFSSNPPSGIENLNYYHRREWLEIANLLVSAGSILEQEDKQVIVQELKLYDFESRVVGSDFIALRAVALQLACS